MGIELSSECMKVMREARAPLSLRDWVHTVSTRTGIKAEIVDMYLRMQFIPNMNVISRDENGNYYVKKEEQQSATDIFDKIASGELVIPLNDEDE